jgi:hypothetical protein
MLMSESKQKKLKFIELRGCEGKSLDLICAELEISKTTAVKYEKEFRDNIEALKKAQFKIYLESVKFSYEYRLDMLTELCNRLFEEIKTRDLKELGTSQLIKSFLDSQSKVSELLDETELKPHECNTNDNWLEF